MRVAEAADGLRGQTMYFNTFDDLEEIPVLELPSVLLYGVHSLP